MKPVTLAEIGKAAVKAQALDVELDDVGYTSERVDKLEDAEGRLRRLIDRYNAQERRKVKK